MKQVVIIGARRAGKAAAMAALARAAEGGADRASAPAAEARAATQRPNTQAETRALPSPPLTQPFTGQSLRVLIEDLKEKAARVRDLPPPSARNPEKFHLERDEIARELAAWATHLERRL